MWRWSSLMGSRRRSLLSRRLRRWPLLIRQLPVLPLRIWLLRRRSRRARLLRKLPLRIRLLSNGPRRRRLLSPGPLLWRLLRSGPVLNWLLVRPLRIRLLRHRSRRGRLLRKGPLRIRLLSPWPLLDRLLLAGPLWRRLLRTRPLLSRRLNSRMCLIRLLLARPLLIRLLRRGLRLVLWLRAVLLLGGLDTHWRRRLRPHIAIGHQRCGQHRACRAPLIDRGKLRPVRAGRALMLKLDLHRLGMRITERRQFRRTGPHLDSTRSAVEAHADIGSILDDSMFVDVVYHRDIDIVNGPVVVEVAAIPIAAFVPDPFIAVAVVDASVIADVRTPVATEEAVTVVPETPVPRRPESALVRRLDPHAGDPVVVR